MKKLSIVLVAVLMLLACSGNNDQDTNEPIINTTPQGYEFDHFDQKISYCIGFDHGIAVEQVYNGENTAGKFNMSDLELGMLDYLGDGELRIDLFSVDSILNLYLGENGEVNETHVSKADASYALGLVEAQTLVGSLVGRGIDQTMDIDFLLKGVTDGMHNNQTTLSYGEVRNEVSQYYSEMNLKMGQSFLDQNGQKEGVITTESGLQYEIIKEGNGITPNRTDSVLVHYTGRFIDGRTFESTIPSGIPAEFTPMGVILGWQEGLLLMKEGGSTRFFIPHELAYGPQGSGPIEPYSTLVFDIELIRVKRFQPY